MSISNATSWLSDRGFRWFRAQSSFDHSDGCKKACHVGTHFLESLKSQVVWGYIYIFNKWTCIAKFATVLVKATAQYGEGLGFNPVSDFFFFKL